MKAVLLLIAEDERDMEALLGRQMGLATLTLPTEAGQSLSLDLGFPSSSDPIAVEMGDHEVVAALRSNWWRNARFPVGRDKPRQAYVRSALHISESVGTGIYPLDLEHPD